MASSKDKKQERATEAVLGGEGSPYAARIEGREVFCAYNGNVLAKLPAASVEGVDKGCKRWVGAIRRELALAVSGALAARNLQGNLVYTVPANEGVEDGRLASGVLVGLSFGGQLFELTTSVTFDAYALDGEDPLAVVKDNCEIAARSLVETVMASRLQP